MEMEMVVLDGAVDEDGEISAKRERDREVRGTLSWGF